MPNMEHLTKKEQDRFDGKCKQSGECKLWTGPLDRDGYGSFYFRKKGRRAHRVAYFSVHGPIPDGMVVDHICKKRHCVQPNHLRLMTMIDNVMQNSNSIGAINRRKTHCKYGHPLDRSYGKGKKQRYCSVCDSAKRVRLAKKWRTEANAVKC